MGRPRALPWLRSLWLSQEAVGDYEQAKRDRKKAEQRPRAEKSRKPFATRPQNDLKDAREHEDRPRKGIKPNRNVNHRGKSAPRVSVS